MRTHRKRDRSPTVPDAEPEARTRWFGLWDGYFAICYVVAVVLVFNSGAGPIGGTVAIGALTATIIWYASLGRGLMLRTAPLRRHEIVFAAGLLVLFGIAVSFNLGASVALFAVVPMLVIALPMVLAVPGILLAHLWPVTLVWLGGGDVNMTVLGILPLSLIGITMSILLGLWITQVVRQSKGRATLIAELRLTRDQVTRLARENGIAAERERLSREIHDTLAQGLVSIDGLVQAAEAELQSKPETAREHLALASSTARENLAEAREFVRALRPPALREGSLTQAVRNLSETLRDHTALEVTFSTDGIESGTQTAVSVVLLRSAQEAMTNVRKHATSARTVNVSVVYSDEYTCITVQDDGDGIEQDAEQNGYGLRGIRARVQEVGGTLTLGRGADRGTVVAITVPTGGQEAEE